VSNFLFDGNCESLFSGINYVNVKPRKLAAHVIRKNSRYIYAKRHRFTVIYVVDISIWTIFSSHNSQ